MKQYSHKITFVQNGRGLWSLDPTMGCASGIANNRRGCYSECYAEQAARRRGFSFGITVRREFESESHKVSIIRKIAKTNPPFIRMGTNGDPSEHWDHTLDVCRVVSVCNIPIVIITRHWKELRDDQLPLLAEYGICINTSVSALDNEVDRNRSLTQYQRLKPFCHSVLRVVSCDFNRENKLGSELHDIQDRLFQQENTIDTVFRCSARNEWVELGIINAKKTRFLGGFALASKRNSNTYFGRCETCPDLCGANLATRSRAYHLTPPAARGHNAFLHVSQKS